MMMKARGRVVVSGMGKTGIIAQKFSATLASTGTPSLFYIWPRPLMATSARSPRMMWLSYSPILVLPQKSNSYCHF